MRIIIEHLPPTGESAYFRARFPRSWWWTPEMDFLSSTLLAVQAGNWQRSGGKGDKPKRVGRPNENKKLRDAPRTAAELAERKRRLKEARYGN